jgi:hypothetical protein
MRRDAWHTRPGLGPDVHPLQAAARSRGHDAVPDRHRGVFHSFVVLSRYRGGGRDAKLCGRPAGVKRSSGSSTRLPAIVSRCRLLPWCSPLVLARLGRRWFIWWPESSGEDEDVCAGHEGPVEGLEGLELFATRVWTVNLQTLQTLHRADPRERPVEGLKGSELCAPHARAVSR